MALRDAVEALGSVRASRRLHEFADLVAAAREPQEVEKALVRLAAGLSGACRVELMLDRDQQDNPAPQRIALWPESAATMTEEEIEALGYPLCLGLWCGDHYQMTLQLYATPGSLKGGRWSPRIVRRLTTICSVAAAAERGLHASQRGRIEAPIPMTAAVRDATFLNAVLPYALAQAQRHREPLTVICVEVDDLPGLARDHGASSVDMAVDRVADAASRTLRGSDVVARLDDGRIMIVLPNTGGPDAMTVATVIRSAMQAVCLPNDGLPTLTVSSGVACFPADSREMLALLNAADEAMNRARALGPNQIATASISPIPAAPAEAPGALSDPRSGREASPQPVPAA